jgi:glycosyltransferase involved in cell wall biosynthesis
MRIAHVITRLIVGGAQENTLLTCADLIYRYGDQVVLLTGPGLGPEGDLVGEVERRGIPMVTLPALRRAIHPWRDWRSYLAIKAELRRFRPDVVHTHSGKAGLLGRSAATSLGVAAVVHTVHGAPFHPYQPRAARAVLRWCEGYAAARCDRIVSVADAMTDQMVAAGVAPREKFVTVYSGMEVEPFLDAAAGRTTIRRELGYCDDDVVVGVVARLFHLKGHGDVIRAARQVAAHCQQVRFLLVGGGVLESTLRQQIGAAGLNDRFQLTGLVPPARIAPLMGAMDIVVHASLREGLARVLPQALIAGKPVVSYDIDGAREVVLPERTGYLLPPRDVDGMARAIAALADDGQLRDQLGDAGRRLWTGRFRHETMTAELRQLYTEILASR